MVNDYYLMKEYANWYPVSREDGKLLIGHETNKVFHFCTSCRLPVEYMYNRCPRCSSPNFGYLQLIDEEIDSSEVTLVETNKFIFALTFQEMIKIINMMIIAGMEDDLKLFVDTHDRQYTVNEFLAVLDRCHLQEMDTRLNWTD
jgi:hypothetical protein